MLNVLGVRRHLMSKTLKFLGVRRLLMSKPLKFLGVRRLLMSKPLKRIHQVLPCMDDLSHQVLPCMNELRYFCICIFNHELCDSRSSLALTQHSPRSYRVLPWINHELSDSR